nr:LacI family DNA-binding transcriptional regulator [Novosphingobium sediminicola]
MAWKTQESASCKVRFVSRPRKPSTGVNILAVAERAGVSPMTVSNVFHGRGRVSEATRERVQRIIEELGYKPSEHSLRLQGRAINNIGFLQFSARIESLYVNATVRAIALAMANKGLHLLSRDVARALPDHTERAAEELIKEGAQALILPPPFGEYLDKSDYFKGLSIPAVAILTIGPFENMATVRFDNRTSIFDLVKLLVDRGRRRIALITGHPAHLDCAVRTQAFRDACLAYDIEVREDWVVTGDYTFTSGRLAAQHLLDMADRPDAIVALNDDMAAGAIGAAHAKGISMPDQLAITGFDDVGLAHFLSPSLTTVRQPLDAIAQKAVSLITDRPISAPWEKGDFVVPYSLSIRESA